MRAQQPNCVGLLLLVLTPIVVFLLIVSNPSLQIPQPTADAHNENTKQSAAITDRTLDFRHKMKSVKRHVDRLQMMLRDDALPPDDNGIIHEHDNRINGRGGGEGKSKNRFAHQLDGAMHIRTDKDAAAEHDTIFVSVAAFRDIECGGTVEDMYMKAKFPQRIFSGIAQQHNPEDGVCITDRLANCTDPVFCARDNLRYRRVAPAQAKGPTFGRYVAALMYQNEKYFMMIDSHSRFLQDWDVILIKQAEDLPTRGVISFYPPAYEGQKLVTSHLIFMCSAHWTSANILRMDGQAIPKPAKALIQPFTAGGFLFGNADFFRDVPFDPYLDYVFDGEEITYTIRLWTSGWDSYLPPEAVIWHFYNRHTAPRIWGVPNTKWWIWQETAHKRIYAILRTTIANSTQPLVDLGAIPAASLKEIDKYGLGKERSLEDYWSFIRVDPVHRVVEKKVMTYCDSIRTDYIK